MKLKNVVAAGAAFCLATSAVVAQAQDQQLPRTASEVSDAENLGGGSFLVPLLALIAVILGILAVTGGDDDDIPTSP